MLLVADADASHEDSYGETPLLMAARLGRADVVAALLNGHSETPHHLSAALTHAISCGSVGVVTLLVAAGADAEARGAFGFRPLLTAASLGHTAIVRVLVRAGVEVNKATFEGETALTLVASYGHVEVVRVLLTVDTLQLHHADRNGDTALLYAVDSSSNETVELLCAAGANACHINDRGETALLGASRHGDLDMVELLLQAGASVDHADHLGNTALQYASAAGRTDVAEALLVTREAIVDHANATGETPLCVAARSGHTAVVQILLAHGADIDHADLHKMASLVGDWVYSTALRTELPTLHLDPKGIGCDPGRH